jgi:hypothetical protein
MKISQKLVAGIENACSLFCGGQAFFDTLIHYHSSMLKKKN